MTSDRPLAEERTMAGAVCVTLAAMCASRSTRPPQILFPLPAHRHNLIKSPQRVLKRIPFFRSRHGVDQCPLLRTEITQLVHMALAPRLASGDFGIRRQLFDGSRSADLRAVFQIGRALRGRQVRQPVAAEGRKQTQCQNDTHHRRMTISSAARVCLARHPLPQGERENK
jgi:hypothetical protein